MSTPPPKKGSGEHPAMTEANRAVDDTRDRLLPLLKRQNERVASVVEAIAHKPAPTTVRRSDWVITIRGSGPHHNGDPRDANTIAALFVRQLGVAGHAISSATFDNGSREEVTSPPPPPDGGPNKDQP